MKILILEDEDPKYEQIESHVHSVIPDAALQREKNWLDYTRAVASTKFDLILLDLLVPRSAKDGTVEDHHEQLVEATRDYLSKSFSTPAIVLTRHSLDEGDFVYNLNLVDINVIPFTDHGEWRATRAVPVSITATTPGNARALDASMLTTRPLAIVLETTLPCSRPGSGNSPA